MGTKHSSVVYTVAMHKGGFTIVELVIAVSILVLLIVIALPRYTAFSQKQDFAVQAHKVVECVQNAQRQAIAPTLPSINGQGVRYTSAIISENGTCFNQQLGSLTSISDMLSTTPTALNSSSATMVNNLKVESVTLHLNNSTQNYPCTNLAKIYFGVLEKGAPVVFACDDGSAISVSPPTINFGSGFGLDLNFIHPDTQFDPQPTRGRLMMDRLGVPIAYQSE